MSFKIMPFIYKVAMKTYGSRSKSQKHAKPLSYYICILYSRKILIWIFVIAGLGKSIQSYEDVYLET